MEPPRRRQAAPAADALWSLPDAALDDILSRLNFRDAVRTSVLSRVWRRRWESLPALSLSLLDGLSTPPAIVDGVLTRYAGRIPDFSIRINRQSLGRVDDWLIALSRRGVQSMDLRCNNQMRIHSSIYSFSQLVTLKLHDCDVPPMPVGFAGFPVLEELELVDAWFTENEVLETIIGGSPLLDVLNLSDVYIASDEDCLIAAPNLRSLTIIAMGDYAWQIGELPRLDNATIELEFCLYEGDFGEFLAGVAHARKLTLTTFYSPYFEDTLVGTLPYTFVNLRSLFLRTHFCAIYTILSTFCLLRNAPNLEELEIAITGSQEQEFEAAEFQNTQWTDGMCARLQVVKINGIFCFSNEMCFIELVLSKATSLRTMSISLDGECSKSDESILGDLNSYRRASPHAQVFFKGITKLNE